MDSSFQVLMRALNIDVVLRIVGGCTDFAQDAYMNGLFKFLGDERDTAAGDSPLGHVGGHLTTTLQHNLYIRCGQLGADCTMRF